MEALRRSVGGAAAEGSEEGDEEAAQGGGRTEGNADADRRQEAGEGVCGEEAGGQAAAEVRLTQD